MAWLIADVGFMVGGADLVLLVIVVKVAGKSGYCCDGNRLSKILEGRVLSVEKEDQNMFSKFWCSWLRLEGVEALGKGRSDEIFDYPLRWAPEMMVVCDLLEGNTQNNLING